MNASSQIAPALLTLLHHHPPVGIPSTLPNSSSLIDIVLHRASLMARALILHHIPKVKRHLFSLA